MSRKELYEQAIENSAVSWCQLYREEKAKREDIEGRYLLLVQKVKQQGKERAVSDSYFDRLKKMAIDDGENWEVTNDDGTKRKVQHKIKRGDL